MILNKTEELLWYKVGVCEPLVVAVEGGKRFERRFEMCLLYEV